MSNSPQASTSNFQPILDKALNEYKRKTGKELITHPLAEEIKGCDSPEAILALLEGKANELDLSHGSDERFTKWLTPTVNVLNALSITLGGGVGTVSSGVSWHCVLCGLCPNALLGISPYSDHLFWYQHPPRGGFAFVVPLCRS